MGSRESGCVDEDGEGLREERGGLDGRRIDASCRDEPSMEGDGSLLAWLHRTLLLRSAIILLSRVAGRFREKWGFQGEEWLSGVDRPQSLRLWPGRDSHELRVLLQASDRVASARLVGQVQMTNTFIDTSFGLDKADRHD